MKRSLFFVCIGLLAATTASAQNPPAQGRSVQVRINDRGPSRRTGKIIDLSYGASRVISMGGTAIVSVE